ncbi:hypothetical protein T4D_13478 [Trichinella pseudospiralis]|uniref:Uncharacterized protein n=1 Tax=Trichinella pseudospiralis TaxID=6337 RepID=A0A0V1FRH0_TRIPS|nr:hypothetical protein T4D_13478 [Trichinella pseudospiralis]
MNFVRILLVVHNGGQLGTIFIGSVRIACISFLRRFFSLSKRMDVVLRMSGVTRLLILNTLDDVRNKNMSINKMHVVDIDLSLTVLICAVLFPSQAAENIKLFGKNCCIMMLHIALYAQDTKDDDDGICLSDVHSLHSVNESHLKAFVLLASFEQLLLLQIALQFKILPNLYGYLVV